MRLGLLCRCLQHKLIFGVSCMMQIHEELSLLAGGKEVKGYIAVVCFLVHEGADWHIKDKKGVSPHQALPSAVAALIAKYLRSQ